MTNIVTALNEGKVSFTYQKADGTTRKATGTTNTTMIPAAKVAPNPNTNESTSIKYFDLEANDWRQFTRSTLDEKSIKVEATA